MFKSGKDLAPDSLQERRERTFILLAGFFLSAMTLLNVIGITKFIQIGPMALAVGVLPYPLTFLCTDLISEFYGKKRANFVVWVGFVLNAFVIFTLWAGHHMPSVAPEAQPPWQVLQLSKRVALPNGSFVENQVELFQLIYNCTAGAVVASMVAYLAAQLVDVQMFHFWKKLTKGKHLWLRNNGSTLVSQLVDSVAVIGITFGAAFFRGEIEFKIILTLLFSNYFFKMCAALVDTLPLYGLVHFLKDFLHLDPTHEQNWRE